jgi:hypothetical protein
MGIVFDKMKADKQEREYYNTAAHRLLGMNVTEYLSYKNPSTIKALNNTIQEMHLDNNSEIIKVYMVGNSDVGSPVFVGLKVRIKSNGSFCPPGKDYLKIGRDHTLIRNKVILIDKNMNKE